MKTEFETSKHAKYAKWRGPVERSAAFIPRSNGVARAFRMFRMFRMSRGSNSSFSK